MAPFTRNLMWNNRMTLKYRQGHRQCTYHLKAFVWINCFSYRGRILYSFWDIGRGNDNIYWNDVQMSLKVTKSGTNRKLVYDFLLVVHSNFCRITHRLREIWRETIKLAISVSVNVSCIICEILDVRIKTQAEMTFKCHSRSSIYQSKTRIWVVISGL